MLADVRARYRMRQGADILYAGIKDFVGRGGKRIRPALLVLSYLGYTKKKRIQRKKLLRCAGSMELLHDFLLVHDDVIDRSRLRRGKPTLHRVFNKKLGLSAENRIGSDLAIVAGDVLFAMAVDGLLAVDEGALRKERALRMFIEAAAVTGIGEFLDVTSGIQNIENITEKAVFRIYTLKTAKYTFECPMTVGAALAGAGTNEIKKLSLLGTALGQAFQIQDDMLDMFSSSKTIGKSVLSDLDESKKTLIVWKAYKRLGHGDRKELKRLLEKSDKNRNDFIEFRALVKKSGAREYCLQKIRKLLLETDSVVRSLRMKERYRKELDGFIRGLFS